MQCTNMPKLSSMLRTIKSSDMPVKIPGTEIQTLTGLPLLSAIDKIECMEMAMLAGDTVELPVNEYRGSNVYVRETLFKAGTVATGRVHKYDHVSILISGHMTIWTPDDGVHDVYGPSITEVRHGMKRAGYAHTDVRWVTAHGVPNAIIDAQDFLTFSKYGTYLDFLEETNGALICHSLL